MRPHALSFSIAALFLQSSAAHALSIMEIQGTGHVSPHVGETLSGVQGVVTAVSGNGFWLQDPLGDGNASTSDAIFVYRGSRNRPAVGDLVSVSGRIDEFRPGCNNCLPGNSAYNNLSITQINSSFGAGSWSRLGSAPLPAPVVIGAAGRTPPALISYGFGGSVESPGYVFNADAHAIDFFESLEGMRVEVAGAQAVGPTNAFKEIALLPDLGAGGGLATSRGGVVLTPGNSNASRIILDDALIGAAAMPLANVGDRLAQTTGVLDYSFGNFKLLVTQSPTLTSMGLERPAAPPARPGQLSIASYNVENLAGNGAQTKFDGIAGQIVQHLGAPDIVALQEVQDNNGSIDDGTVAADQTYGRLIAAITAAGGPSYQYVNIDPADNADGGAPGANIRVGYLYDPSRVSFVEAVRVDPTHPAWDASRKPLAATFTFGGEQMVFINDHLKSKSGDEPLFGRFQPPTAHTEFQRNLQAQVLAAYVEALRAGNPHVKVVVLGDLNDFQFSHPLQVLTAAGLANLTDTLPENARYTYVYDGNSQTLDHILVSLNLVDAAEYQVLHLNSEFAVGDPLRYSDHDPLLLRLNLSPIPEPGTWAMLLAGLGWVVIAARRRS
ncbi:MAG: endonuclease/exonuclease/phosphatase family protein [Thiobacillaceae bacterium]